jgi:hypothetical protein
MTIQLLDTANKVILSRKVFALKIEAAGIAHPVSLDRMGRVLVNGKPYLPVGLYIGNLSDWKLDVIAKSPFNCIMPYGSLNLKCGTAHGTGLEVIRQALDKCRKKNVKVVFSLKDVYPKGATNYACETWNGITGPDNITEAIVNGLKDHPALLAWYVCDELDVSWSKQLTARRRQVNELDPGHPTLAIFYQYDKLPYYLNGFDILGTDSYPIVNRDSDNMKSVERLSRAAFDLFSTGNGGGAIWAVPQLSNAGCFHKDSRRNLKLYREKFRPPTYQEMLSMCLLEAINGAKGFLFYSFSDLERSPDKDEFNKRWPEICKVAAELRGLEPFLLGTPADADMKLVVKQGDVKARAFKAEDGKICVLIAAIGPGAAEAEITVPGNLTGLKSTTGHTAEKDNGKYLFSGKDICSDILK